MPLSDVGSELDQLRLLRALKRVQIELPTEYELIMSALEKWAEETDVDLRESEDTVCLYRLQGRVGFITEFAQMWVDCPQTEKSIRENVTKRGHG